MLCIEHALGVSELMEGDVEWALVAQIGGIRQRRSLA